MHASEMRDNDPITTASVKPATCGTYQSVWNPSKEVSKTGGGFHIQVLWLYVRCISPSEKFLCVIQSTCILLLLLVAIAL